MGYDISITSTFNFRCKISSDNMNLFIPFKAESYFQFLN